MPVTIEAELNRIWESLEGTNKIRASLFNLIFYTKNTPRSAYIKTIAQSVVEKFPSRVILITANEKEDYLRSEVSVRPIGDDVAVCEFIEIEVGGKDLERLPFVLLPNLLPDLPIYVIWSEDPQNHSPLFSLLSQVATRMIFDSEGSGSLPQFAKTLTGMHAQNSFDIADLNWARTENWRKLLASTFYTDENLHHLMCCSRIDIFYNALQPPFPSQTEVQALFLQGWVASQLNWKLEKSAREKASISLNYRRPDEKEIQVHLYPEEHKTLKGGAIVSVDIQTDDQCHFSFGRDLKTPHQVHMRFSTLERCDIPLQYLFPKNEAGQSLVKEICHRGTSSHYLRLLGHIEQYPETLR